MFEKQQAVEEAEKKEDESTWSSEYIVGLFQA